MTEVLFYHLQDMTLEQVLPQLLEKTYERGWRAIVQASSDERVDALDGHLWTYRDDSFLPHGTGRSGDPAGEPILLTAQSGNPNGASVRFLVEEPTLPDDAQTYDRIVVVFDGNDDAALQKARETWMASRAHGFAVTYWQADQNGRWQKRE
jgi:DNA polymerase-3 subunit chi